MDGIFKVNCIQSSIPAPQKRSQNKDMFCQIKAVSLQHQQNWTKRKSKESHSGGKKIIPDQNTAGRKELKSNIKGKYEYKYKYILIVKKLLIKLVCWI